MTKFIFSVVTSDLTVLTHPMNDIVRSVISNKIGVVIMILVLENTSGREKMPASSMILTDLKLMEVEIRADCKSLICLFGRLWMQLV